MNIKEIVSKKELDETMKIKGELRGAGFREVAEFIIKEKGKEGLRKLEDAMASLGYPISFKDIKITQFYPLKVSALSFILIKMLFNFSDEKFQEMGRFNARLGLIFRFLIKYLVSLKRATKAVPKMWKTYYTVGDLRAMDYDEDKKYVLLRLDNFNVHPIYCQIFKGFFAAVLEIIVKSKVTCEQTKCYFLGDKYHEFLLKW